MNTAANNPVRRSKPEINTGDFAVGQKSPIIMPEDGSLPDREAIALAPAMDGGKPLSRYMADIAFNEEPMVIRVEPSGGKNQARVVDCWVNGKGAEQLINGKWLTLGWLPVGVPVTTKRKYVETLLRSKKDSIETDVIKYDEHEDNLINRSTSSSSPLSILHDANPAGVDWVQKILMEG